jgi:uncharacterized RDD family membrane protein YckC
MGMSTVSAQSVPVITLDDTPPVATRGVMGSRIIAWIVDALMLTIIAGLAWLILIILVPFTLGTSLFFMPVVAVGAVMAYAAIMISGSRQATIGMRMTGLMVTDMTENRPQALNAAVHALLFYVAAPAFPVWLAMIGIGFLRSDRRFGHDLIAGLRIGRRR